MEGINKSIKVMLAGNPNVGKTSLYNRLTRSYEHVGNWHGVTVEGVSKTISFNGKNITICDLPGIYSLTVFSPEEAVSRQLLLEGKHDLVICVCEVNNLSRNLYLALQLLELGVPVLIAVNMIDELKRSKRTINTRLLSDRLNVDVITLSAKQKASGSLILNNIDGYVRAARLKKGEVSLPYLNKLDVFKVQSQIQTEDNAARLNSRFAAIKLLEGDFDIIKRLNLSKLKMEVLKPYFKMDALVASARFSYIDSIMEGVICDLKENELNYSKVTKGGYINGKSRLDSLALSKIFALPLFLLVMAGVFYLTFSLIGPVFSDLMELGIERLVYKPIAAFLRTVGCAKWFSAVCLEGIIMGIGGVLTFLPQIVLLFFFLALLEDSGYISRVAFMTDGLFSKVGLSGRSGFTLLMGFGCSATAVMTARTLEDDNTRKKTILLTPFMSCSARLPVFAVISAAFFGRGSVFIIFLMYVLGVLAAFLLAFVLEKIDRFKSGNQSFIMELPPYRLPSLERVFQLIKSNVVAFLVRVGTVVFALNTILWILSNFSLTHGYTVGTDYKSIFEVLGTIIAPIFKPLGFGDWKATTSLLGGIAAKEVVISLIESLGGVESVFEGRFAMQSALSFMSFTLLYVPCVATLSAIKRETGFKWMMFCLVTQFLTAYLFSLVIYWGAVLIL